MRMFNPAHPGLLIKEYIEGFESNVSVFAEKLGITRVTLSRIVNGKSGITPEMALRLSKLLTNTTPNFWLGLQSDYDLWQAEQKADFDIQPFVMPAIGEETRPSA